MIGRKSRQHTLKSIYHRIEYLANVMTEIEDAWNERMRSSNILPHIFSARVKANLDTFPIYVNVPSDSAWAKALFSGKYGGAVVNVSL